MRPVSAKGNDAPEGRCCGVPKSKTIPNAAGLAVSGSAAAAGEIFLRLDGIAGGATAGHANEIIVSTYSQAFSNTSRSVAGGAGTPITFSVEYGTSQVN